MPAPEWTRFSDRIPVPPGITLWRSDADDDPAWDAFLLGTRLGQFQQSSAWARVKKLEGWRATRFIAMRADCVVAGFQLLWKSRYGMRFGYVSKGPVVLDEPDFTASDAVDLLKRATLHLGLVAVIAQPPDFGNNLESPFAAAGLLENRLQSVYSATVIVDLDRPFPEVVRGFSHDVARQIRNLQKNHITHRFGGLEDAGLFHSLMAQSCAKQRVTPNPSHPDGIRAIMHEFRPATEFSSNPLARFLFAERDGRAIAGFLLIRFGQCLSLWKKGVASDAGRTQPNRLLDCEAMKWGQSLGCSYYDVVAIDRLAAERLLDGHPRATVPMKPSDNYKLDFGGRPVLLPEARVWIPSTAGRALYRLVRQF